MMRFFSPFLLTAGGLFDFDLTFAFEIGLFVVFSLAVTSLFLSPISTILRDRAKEINGKVLRASLLVTVGYNQFTRALTFLTGELKELNRQVELTKAYGTTTFDQELTTARVEKDLLLQELKKNLSSDSASLFWKLRTDVRKATEDFFTKKFQSR